MNIKKLLKLCPNGFVKGIDYSAVSVAKANNVNSDAVSIHRCVVLQENVADMIFASEWFDAVTAFDKDVQLKAILEQAGFHDIQIHKNEKGWLCILVQKQQYDAEGIKYSERDI